jgi:hypothetical protein
VGRPEVTVLFVDTRPVDAVVFHHDLLGADDPKASSQFLSENAAGGRGRSISWVISGLDVVAAVVVATETVSVGVGWLPLRFVG